MGAIVNFLGRRKRRKAAEEMLRHSQHLRNLREDVMSPRDLQQLTEGEKALGEALRSGDPEATDRTAGAMEACVSRLSPRRSMAATRENVEVVVVAIAVAMAFRTYFIQPFKIPTGSMQPTLYGIHTVTDAPRGFMDHLPVKLLKWFVTGEWHQVIKAKASGHMSELRPSPQDPSVWLCTIAGIRHKLPSDAVQRGDIHFRPNDFVPKGSILWTGIRTAGDHVFVDKVRWNFTHPKRGQIVVFNTEKIADLPQGTHYIKRLLGMPGEVISIAPPRVLVNGNPLSEPRGIERIANREPGYEGFSNAGMLSGPNRAFRIPERAYFAMGDNTGNSKDSRYWGEVPQINMVGPALVVYWPFSLRWGLAR